MQLNKQIVKPFFLSFFYALLFYAVQYALYSAGIISLFPTEHTLLNWDAKWYYTIVHYGYEYSLEGYSNSGFFILFPLIWKLLGLTQWGVCLMNITLFSAGFALFARIYKLRTSDMLLWLTFPSIYIAFLPYSEALFVFLSVLAFWGIVKDKKAIVWVALFLLSLTRPVTVILTPAFFIAELLTNDNKSWWQSVKKFMVYYGAPLLSGLALFIWYQHSVTGVWLAYFKQQEMHWGHEFSLPTLPFGSAFGPRLLWLNAAALFMSFFSLLLLVGYGIKWLFKNTVQKDKLYIVSCLYFTGIGLITILFNPTWGINSTNIYDIARYAFVTPFSWVLLHRFSITRHYKIIDYLKALVLLNLFWLSFDAHQSTEKLAYCNLTSLFVLLYMFQTDKRLKWPAYVVLVGVGIIFQTLMLQWYLGWEYPG